jgi:hypothetical protein
MPCAEARMYGDCNCCDWGEPEELYECMMCGKWDSGDLCYDCQWVFNELHDETTSCLACGHTTCAGCETALTTTSG